MVLHENKAVEISQCCIWQEQSTLDVKLEKCFQSCCRRGEHPQWTVTESKALA